MALETPNALFAAVVWDITLDNGGPDFAVEVKRAINVANFALVAPDDPRVFSGTFINPASQLEICCEALNGSRLDFFFVAPLLFPTGILDADALADGDFLFSVFPAGVPGPGERVRGYVQMHAIPLLEAVA